MLNLKDRPHPCKFHPDSKKALICEHAADGTHADLFLGNDNECEKTGIGVMATCTNCALVASIGITVPHLAACAECTLNELQIRQGPEIDLRKTLKRARAAAFAPSN